MGFTSSIFCDVSEIIKNNPDYLIYIFVGAGGVGKSYSQKKYVIERFLEYGEQFVYLRRFDDELNRTKREYFNDIASDLGYDIVCKNDQYTLNEETFGHAISLNCAGKFKSSSFPKVKTIIFEEFLPEVKNHYIPDEIRVFYRFMETVFRANDDCRVLMSANALTMFNPYFLEFGLRPNNKGIAKKDDLVYMQILKNEAFANEKKKTKFGRLTAGTEFGEYNMDNKFLFDSSTNIERKNRDCKCHLIFTFRNDMLGLWIDTKTKKGYVSFDYDPKCPLRFNLTLDNGKINKMHFTKRSMLYLLYQLYTNDMLCFESGKVKAISERILKYFI